MNNRLIKKVVKALCLKRHIEFRAHTRLIRKQINKVSHKALGYYTFAYSEKRGQHHVIDYSTKAHEPTEVILHELIHAWQAENGFWNYGHGEDFKAMVMVIALVTGVEYDDILEPSY